jgi:vanillate O-demethylase ferredoxin subunit
MLNLRIKAAVWEAPNIISYDLRPTDGKELPQFTAGAHIDIKLPGDMMRSYSLTNSQSERHRYVIAVQKDRESRGGSKWIIQNFRPGEILSVSEPRNNFKLDETAENSVFIAGGIGITPMLSMIDRLNTLGKKWELIFCSRTRNSAPFLERLQAYPGVRLHFDREPGAEMLDLNSLVAGAGANAHLYCCGPVTMLEVFEKAAKARPSDTVHVEYFTATEPPATEGGFVVVLARTGREITIPAGKTILSALRDEGLNVAHSCAEGICGTCETTVIEGIPDHRDRILTEKERLANKKMMICCSGAKTEKLVLDL